MKKKTKTKKSSTLFFTNEQGFSFIEILGAIVILGISLILIASMIFQNRKAIALNTQREEAIAVRDDIKEWLSYKAQIQDITNLNQWVYLFGDTNARQRHFILDNSGIQYEAGKAKYGEIPIDESDTRRGRFIRKVQYDPPTGSFLPAVLAEDENNKLYMGQYLTETGTATNYLVKVLVTKIAQETGGTIADARSVTNRSADIVLLDSYFERPGYYDTRNDGVLLTIQIFDKVTGRFLTETYLNWVAGTNI
ncbi:type IV pilus modification PilV family protein [Enterococcus faecalis]